jgi:hypothetical protein
MHSIYPADWAEMTMLVNSVVLNALRQLSHTIRDYFSVYFEHDAWNNFFLCSISFLTQHSLQLEQFSQMKRNKIYARWDIFSWSSPRLESRKGLALIFFFSFL